MTSGDSAMDSRRFNPLNGIRCPSQSDSIADRRASSQGIVAVQDFGPAERRFGYEDADC
jgi:hypothetical protein